MDTSSREKTHFGLEFISMFVQEAGILESMDVQAYMALLHYIQGLAEDQCISVRGSSRVSKGEIICWLEAVLYL